MNSLYNSEQGKKEILELYDLKLKELNIQYESLIISTSYGQTHILVTGSSNKPPLILIHGSNASAPIALECYPKLSTQYQVFAIDVLAQPNKSEGTRLSMKDDSYSKWMNELIDYLEIKDVVLAGFSFGGLIILKTLIYNPSKIKEVFMASPAYIVNANPLKTLFKIFIPLKLYMITNKLKYMEKFLSLVFTIKDEFALNYLSKAFKYFTMDFTPVPIISKIDAQKINTPITLIAAKKDIIFPGDKMIERSKSIFPNLKHTVLLENSKHVQGPKGNSIVEELIIKTSYKII